jgi:methylphosphotriester-DNA--protein-cysteine methyltransferase
MFKDKTGMTITHYLTLKRIETVKINYAKGKSLSTACLEAGFGTYGNFAYNYKKIFGKAPKEDLK